MQSKDYLEVKCLLWFASKTIKVLSRSIKALLVFYLAADTVLCFSLRMRITLIKHSFSCCPASKEADVHKGLGADTSQVSRPQMTKGYPTPYGTIKLREVGPGRALVTPWGLAGHQSVEGEQLYCVSLVLYILSLLFSPPFLSC